MGDFILACLGKAYLYFRFRNKAKVQQELQRKYEGQLRNAGTVLLADMAMALAVVAIASLLAAALYFATT